MNEKKRVIALGFFDGVHLGHAALLQKVAEVAARRQLTPTALTFDTHPGDLIVGAPTPLLSSPTDRADLMRRYYGIRDVIVVHFDERMMKMDWQDFIAELLVKEYGAVYLVAGHDFHFGYKGEGNPERLKAKCSQLGLGCDIVPKVELDGVTISSTYIRGLLSQGEVERANLFLGHPHTLTDTVGHGKKLGSTLGFPTVNLHFAKNVLVPAHGVYATKVFLPNGDHRMAATSIGRRPTVDKNGEVNVEGFLLDFDGDLYGQTLRMEFHKFLRPELKFDNLEALRIAVLRDAEATRNYFTS